MEKLTWTEIILLCNKYRVKSDSKDLKVAVQMLNARTVVYTVVSSLVQIVQRVLNCRKPQLIIQSQVILFLQVILS